LHGVGDAEFPLETLVTAFVDVVVDLEQLFKTPDGTFSNESGVSGDLLEENHHSL
jgi:hypothetical protein